LAATATVGCRFDSPGHAAAICTGYPDACPDPQCLQPLNPVNPLSLQILNGVLTEWAAIFPLSYMHLGGAHFKPVFQYTKSTTLNCNFAGDEVDDTCWSDSPSIMAWAKARNYTVDVSGYQADIPTVDYVVV
jgi:N-acetyl-beta-hexosaminidase